ncbi:hypothetical protein [Microtetraspora malaysiensis]|uniref:Uncharacterized protein n=1 Tax=Microtetraspora malaysiensis TaxID=161358 RepID=A0ABW6T363_9ACTN
MSEPDLAVAVAELRLVVVTGLTEIRGELALIRQHNVQSERRVDGLASELDTTKALLDTTREQLGELRRTAVTKDEATERNRRQLTISGLMLTAATVVIAIISLVKGG